MALALTWRKGLHFLLTTPGNHAPPNKKTRHQLEAPRWTISAHACTDTRSAGGPALVNQRTRSTGTALSCCEGPIFSLDHQLAWAARVAQRSGHAPSGRSPTPSPPMAPRAPSGRRRCAPQKKRPFP